MKIIVAVLFACLLSGCAAIPALTVAGAATGGITGIYQTWRSINSDVVGAVTQACKEWAIQKAIADTRAQLGAVPTANAAKIKGIALWAEAACNPNNPPPADPLATAVWLAGLAGEIAILSEVKP